MRGRPVKCRLQKPTQTATTTSSSGSTTYADQGIEFKANLSPLSSKEQLRFDRETTMSMQKLMFMRSDISAKYLSQIKESNRIVIMYKDAEIDPVVYDIVGTQAYFNRSGRKVLYWAVFIQETK